MPTMVEFHRSDASEGPGSYCVPYSEVEDAVASGELDPCMKPQGVERWFATQSDCPLKDDEDVSDGKEDGLVHA